MHRFRLICILIFASAGCGGGGAAVAGPDSQSAANPAAAPSGPSTPTPPGTPGSAVVTTAGTSFAPATITVVPGAVVTWQISGATHNVTFGGLKPTGGDIPDSNAGSQVSRTFAAAGTFDYQCTRHSGMTGRVVVTADGAAPVTPPVNPTEGTIVQASAAAFSPERIEIAPGAVVTWQFAEGAGGIVFDDDAIPAGGNIPAASPGTRVSRTFTAPGDYEYHSSKSRDTKGRVRVR